MKTKQPRSFMLAMIGVAGVIISLCCIFTATNNLYTRLSELEAAVAELQKERDSTVEIIVESIGGLYNSPRIVKSQTVKGGG